MFEDLLNDWLSASLLRHGVPGGLASVLTDGQITTVAAGLARLDTNQKFTPSTVFQFGSIAKVYTASLAMQAVEEGHLKLTDHIVDVLPGFALADERYRDLTLRHLLTHTSGLPQDHFIDTGRGDDCRARYVEAIRDLQLTHAPGAQRSYANANYVLTARVLEVLDDNVWEELLRSKLLAPAELNETFLFPEEIVIRPFALGYWLDEDRRPAYPAWGGPKRAYAACGSTPSATASDLLRFAALHLDEGCSVSGKQVLRRDTVREMQAEAIDVDEPAAPISVRPVAGGLGWMHYDLVGSRWIGHDGATAGQVTLLRVLPIKRCAFMIYANAANGQLVFEDLAEPIANALLTGFDNE